MSQQTIAKATALKRILAFIYDLFLIIPLMMLTALIWLPFNNGMAIEPGNLLHPFMIATSTILAPILFYTYFWHKGGQTLGMRSWRLRVVNTSGNNLAPKQSATRAILFVFSWILILMGFNMAIKLDFTAQAILPLALALIAIYGFIMAFTAKRVSLVDILTHSRVMQLPKVKKS